MKSRGYIRLIITTLIFMVSAVHANTYEELTAEFMLAGKIAYGDLEKGQSHLYIKIKGNDALKLFDAMNVKTVISGCLGVKEKTQGNISCYSAQDESDSYCVFAVNIEENKIDIGETC